MVRTIVHAGAYLSYELTIMELKAGIVCDRGLNPRRAVNQDRYLALPERGLFAVFDGVGGQRAGEVASQTAADTIEEAVRHDSASSPAELIRRAIQFANRDIFELAASNPEFRTMATTVALIHCQDGKITVAHVGDSRVYRLEDGVLHRETIDHTDLDDDIRSGKMNRSDASEFPDRNVINRALGVESEVDTEVKSLVARDGTRFLLCSDGIYKHLSDKEIGGVLARIADVQQAADELKKMVLQRGADDNLTAVVVQLGRARQTSSVRIDDGSFDARHAASGEFAGSARKRAADGSAAAMRRVPRTDSEERRIRVELARSSAESSREPFSDPVPASPSKAIMYSLLVAVLVAGAFYAGLRASDWFKMRPNSSQPAASADSLAKGIEIFQRADFQSAAAEFDAVSKREPGNPLAFYWLGRARLEQRDFPQAASNLELAISMRPSIYDAYVQAAAAYEAMGDRAKTMAMLARYAEERKKEIR